MEPTLPTTPQPADVSPLHWEKYGKSYVAFDGDEIVGMVAPAEGAPCEMWAFQPVHNCFVSLETAQRAGEMDYADAKRDYDKQKMQKSMQFRDTFGMFAQALGRSMLDLEYAAKLRAAVSAIDKPVQE